MRVKLIEEDSRYVVTDCGKVVFLPRGTETQPFLNHKGYQLVRLGHDRTYSLHRIVAKAFVENPNPEVFNQVNHIDGNKENNHYSNLEWTDNSGNQTHAYYIGLNEASIGENNVNAKLTEKNVRDLCEKFCLGIGTAKACRELGIYHLKDAARQVKDRNNWKHVSIEYNF